MQANANGLQVIGIILTFCFSAVGSELRILTYNVGLLQVPPIGDVVAHVSERAEELPRSLSQMAVEKRLDVIVLQELWSDAHAELVKKALEPLGYEITRPAITYGVGTGLLLATNSATIKNVKTEFFPFEIERLARFEKFTDKGFLLSRLQMKEGGSFYLVSTHLQCLAIDPKTGLSTGKDEANAHAAQILFIKETLGAKNPAPKLPILVAGDFNAGPKLARPNYEAMLKELGLANAHLDLSPNSTAVTWDQQNPLVKGGEFPNDPSAMVDHILFGTATPWKPLESETVFQNPVPTRDYPLSDHYGLYLRLMPPTGLVPLKWTKL